MASLGSQNSRQILLLVCQGDQRKRPFHQVKNRRGKQVLCHFYSVTSEVWEKVKAEVSLASLASLEKTNYMLRHQITNQVNIQAFSLARY